MVIRDESEWRKCAEVKYARVLTETLDRLKRSSRTHANAQSESDGGEIHWTVNTCEKVE